MAAGSVAAVRERDELRHPAGLAGRRVYLAVSLGFDQIGTPLRQGLERLRAQVMHDVSGADDHDARRRGPTDGAPTSSSGFAPATLPSGRSPGSRPGTFRSERGYHTAMTVVDALGTRRGRDGDRAGRPRVHGAA